MKIVSWNVNGIRAIAKKGFKEMLEEMDADVVCLQETKAQDDQVAEVIRDYGYHFVSNSAVKKGYSGTAILSKEKPIEVLRGIGKEEHDNEGRVLTAEFEHFYVVCVYVPNAQAAYARLPYREQWDVDFMNFFVELEKKKPVVVLGDLNVIHKEIDIKNFKSNYNKSPGCSQTEMDGLTEMIRSGFTDTFRHLYPDTVKYSWWSYRFNSRANNTGWRLDYALGSKGIMDRLEDAFILNEYHGSDHCPIGVLLKA
ncbi:MAG: exodeoxyribonuclease III [Flavobacteriales bacterium]|nr:exodeoxyribonuclease III [Flavobacteriales bacterium]